MSALDFPTLIARVIRQESGGNPNAVSPVGASGLMQIMPATAADPGFGLAPLPWDKVFDPQANRAFGEAYLSKMLERYGGDQARALAAYNWGAGNADKWDGNLASLPAETRNYVTSILGNGAAWMDQPFSMGTPGDTLPMGGLAPIPAFAVAENPFADVLTGGTTKPKQRLGDVVASVQADQDAALQRARGAGMLPIIDQLTR